MKNFGRGIVFAVLILTSALVVASSQEGYSESSKATAVLNPTEGSQVKGLVSFEQNTEGVLLTATLEGLTPGLHGFHIHEKSDCSAPDASSAGGHYNPTEMPHGGPSADKHHIGDLGNLEADSSGKAQLNITIKGLSLEGNNPIIGRSVIVHAQADDLTTQPSGASGARVACGIIRK